jgi:aspartyl-tRNA(Asn)/glutamyl-tRNA(Gln) amidotransferase subunit A
MSAEAPTIAGLARALAARETTAADVTTRCLDRIAQDNPALNAFITVFEERALEAARTADTELDAGHSRGPLHGVPLSLKDLIDVRGITTTAGSRVRQAHVAAADAVVVTRLREAGAILVGKTNLHEFAFGTTNEDSAFGPARHPLDPARSPGGSSGGSAVSVLTGMAFGSIGTDTGGSIRIPAAACGLVGLKPAYGEIPTDGVVPLSPTMDHVGPLCHSVEDATTLYHVLRGGPAPPPQPPARAAQLRLGVLGGYFTDLLDPQIAGAFVMACERLRAAGARLEEVTIPHAGDLAPIYLHIVLAEAAAFHAKTLESRPDDYTPNVRLRFEVGRYVMAEDYVRALRGRELLRHEVDVALAGRDALLLPALAIPAPRLGVETIRIGNTDEPVRALTLRLTQLFNVTGHPAIAIPCGRTVEGLPVGAQLAGARHDTSGLLRTAAALEPFFRAGGPA